MEKCTGECNLILRQNGRAHFVYIFVESLEYLRRMFFLIIFVMGDICRPRQFSTDNKYRRRLSVTYYMTAGSDSVILFRRKSDKGEVGEIAYERDEDSNLEPGTVSVRSKLRTAVKSTCPSELISSEFQHH